MRRYPASEPHASAASRPIARATVLMTDNKNADVFTGASVNQGVWETSEGKTAPTPTGGCAEARIQNQQLANAFKFNEERASHTDSALVSIERESLLKLPYCFRRKGIGH